MALKTIAELLEEIETAISDTLTSQEYRVASYSQRKALLSDLQSREKYLIEQGEIKGFNSTLTAKRSSGAYRVIVS